MDKVFLLFFLVISTAHGADVIVLGKKLQVGATKTSLNVVDLNQLEIQERGIETVRDLADSTANLQIVGSSSSRYITPYIRGQGNQDLNLPDDISVMFYLDEIPLPRYAFETELFDLSSIQVLRGPQGTLFGKNTQAGAVLLNTASPADTLAGNELSVGRGNFDQWRFRLKSNYSWGEKIKGRSAVLFKDSDGWIKDRVLNRDLGARQTQVIQNSFIYSISENQRLQFNIGAQREKGDDPFFVARTQNQEPLSGQDKTPFYERDLLMASVKYELDLGSRSTLTALTSMSYYDFQVSYDEADFFVSINRLTNLLGANTANSLVNNPNVLYRDIKEYDRQSFSELRLKTRFNELTTLNAGMALSVGNYRIDSFVNTFTGASLSDIQQNIQLKSLSYSMFADLEHKFNDRWALSVGARGNVDEKEFLSDHKSVAVSSYQQKSQSRFDDVTARVALVRSWTDWTQTYVSLARGYQPGGYPSFQLNNFRGLSRDQEPFNKSVSTNYEVGHKIKSEDKSFEFQGAFFYNDVRARQIRVRDQITNNSRYQNVDSEIFGGELEARRNLFESFNFGGSLGYTNSRFTQTVISSGSETLKNNDRTANVPYFNAGVFAGFSHYLLAWNSYFFTRLAYAYTGSRFGENRNQTRLPSFGLWNWKIGLDGERWAAEFKVTNLFDKRYDSQAFYFTTFEQEVSSPGLPRMLSLDLTYRF